MEYTLKDKLTINNEFLKDLETKSWQEIEHLQNQIANIEDTAENAGILQLLKSLLTSYYVFTGCLENIENEPIDTVVKAEPAHVAVEAPQVIPEKSVKVVAPKVDILPGLDYKTEAEPFEYFVDFDEPTGEPLTDDDLYN
jgi:hypothetical protein